MDLSLVSQVFLIKGFLVPFAAFGINVKETLKLTQLVLQGTLLF